VALQLLAQRSRPKTKYLTTFRAAPFFHRDKNKKSIPLSINKM
jgi:hypothetical protein